ncbi:MAG: hypothetical protein QM756_35060 [Polyangiaceae bacterium]
MAKLGGSRGMLVVSGLLSALLGPGVETVQAQTRATTAPLAATRGVAEAVIQSGELVGTRVEAVAAQSHTRLRRVKQVELTDELIELSANVIKRHYADRVGSEVALECRGTRYVARIERHYHPEGGDIKPWGFHPGVSLFVVL